LDYEKYDEFSMFQDDRNPPASHPVSKAIDHSQHESHQNAEFNVGFRTNYGDYTSVASKEGNVYPNVDSPFHHSPESVFGSGDNAGDMVPNAEAQVYVTYVIEQVDEDFSLSTPSPVGNGDEFYSHVETSQQYKVLFIIYFFSNRFGNYSLRRRIILVSE